MGLAAPNPLQEARLSDVIQKFLHLCLLLSRNARVNVKIQLPFPKKKKNKKTFHKSGNAGVKFRIVLKKDQVSIHTLHLCYSPVI